MAVGLRSEHSLDFFHNGEPIFALATVPGKSAVAVFRCSGPKIWLSLQHNFSRYASLESAASHSAIYGLLCEAPQREIIDEVLLLKFCAPRSYTGEDMLEIQCHGSTAVLERIRNLLLELGLRQAQRGEFSYRSIRCGKRGLHQAEALALLAQSQTQNQRRDAFAQLSSPFMQNLRELRHELLQVLARTELQLDYDETELEFHYPLPDSLPLAQKSLAYLRDSLKAFELQQSHWQASKIVLVGATNSGKSSLFNRLLNSERSIVSARAGTTRDYLEAELELNGQGVRLFDTAGLREQQVEDPIEQEGIQRTRQLLEQADLLVLVSDVTQQDSWYRQQLCQLAAKVPLFEVWNKCDLLSDRPPTLPQKPPNYQHFICSAVSGEGLPQLIEALRRSLPSFHFGLEAPTNERQAECLHEACALLEEYGAGLEDGRFQESLDWPCELLRQICGRLGEATGEETNAEILRGIFEQFCVGK